MADYQIWENGLKKRTDSGKMGQELILSDRTWTGNRIYYCKIQLIILIALNRNGC